MPPAAPTVVPSDDIDQIPAMDDHVTSKVERLGVGQVGESSESTRFVETYVPKHVSDEQRRRAIRQAIVAAPRDASDRALRPAI